MLVLGRRWWLVSRTASLPPRKYLRQNFTCVFDSVDSPYCARNLHQISLGPTLSLVRNFITTRCEIVIGTSLSLIFNPNTGGDGLSGTARWGGSPHITTPTHKFISISYSFAGCSWQRSVSIWPHLRILVKKCAWWSSWWTETCSALLCVTVYFV